MSALVAMRYDLRISISQNQPNTCANQSHALTVLKAFADNMNSDQTRTLLVNRSAQLPIYDGRCGSSKWPLLDRIVNTLNTFSHRTGNEETLSSR